MINWIAVIAGVAATFALGFGVYGRFGFQRRWAEGTRISPDPPAQLPVGAMGMQILSLVILAIVIAITATTDSLILAILAIFAVATNAATIGAWAQKSGFAIAVDTGYVLGSGTVMILAQGIF